MLDQFTERFMGILHQEENVKKFSTAWEVYPVKAGKKVLADLHDFNSTISNISPSNPQESVILGELKRRIEHEIFVLGHYLSGQPYDFRTLTRIYGIPQGDIDNLEPWLRSNKERVEDLVQDTFESEETKNYRIKVDKDNLRDMEEITKPENEKILFFHKNIVSMFKLNPELSKALEEIVVAPTIKDNHYFSSITKTLEFSIPEFWFKNEHGEYGFNVRDFLLAYGHECTGHALIKIYTEKSDLPRFIRSNSSVSSSTQESVSQFYEKVIFDLLRKSPSTLRSLALEDNFEHIYKIWKIMREINDYKHKLQLYGICVSSDKELGDHKDPKVIQKKKDLISRFQIFPQYAENFVERSLQNLDTNGNPDDEFVRKLIYSADPVGRALREFQKQGITYAGQGRSIIDQTFLTGYWTPIGFVENARLAAQTKKI